MAKQETEKTEAEEPGEAEEALVASELDELHPCRDADALPRGGEEQPLRQGAAMALDGDRRSSRSSASACSARMCPRTSSCSGWCSSWPW